MTPSKNLVKCIMVLIWIISLRISEPFYADRNHEVLIKFMMKYATDKTTRLRRFYDRVPTYLI